MFSGIAQTQSQQLFLLRWAALIANNAGSWITTADRGEKKNKNATDDKRVLCEAAIIMTFYLWAQIPEFSLFRCYRVCHFSIASLRRRGTRIDEVFLWQSNGLSLKIQTCSCCSVSLSPLPPCPPVSTLRPSPESNVYICRKKGSKWHMSTGNCLIGKRFTHSHMLIIQQETGNLGFSVVGVSMPHSTSRIRQHFSYCTSSLIKNLHLSFICY